MYFPINDEVRDVVTEGKFVIKVVIYKHHAIT